MEEDIVRFFSYRRIDGGSEERDHADTSETQR